MCSQPICLSLLQVQQQVKDGVAMNPINLCPQRHRIKKMLKLFGENIHWIPFTEACKHPQGPVGTFLSLWRRYRKYQNFQLQ